MEHPPFSFDVLLEHFRNKEDRLAALNDAFNEEVHIYYRNILSSLGLKEGDAVKYHNKTYLVTDLVIFVKDSSVSERHYIEFALERSCDSYRWIPLQFIDKLIKINQ